MDFLEGGTSSTDLVSLNLLRGCIKPTAPVQLVIAHRLNSSSKTVKSAIQSFMDRESQKAQVAVLLISTGAATTDIESAPEALEFRNRIANEGYHPTPAEEGALPTVVQISRRLADIDEIKCPVLSSTNMLAPPR